MNGDIDYESVTSFALLIEAMDGGSPPLTSTFQLTVSVDDVNDNVPTFTGSQTVFEVSEVRIYGLPCLYKIICG